MAVINIRKAQRSGARLVVNIAGISGSGKTFSALQLAFGLANFDASKVGFIDTENRRGSLYADALVHPVTGEVQQFLIGDLEPPFTPQRYSDAIKAFQDAGVEVLVIDSISHEYEGTGGILEMREPLPGKAGKRDNIAKAEHKKMMNTLLQSSMHIVACVRAREKVIIEKKGGETVYIPQGVQPIQEKNFMFEATASLMMWDAGKSQQVLKCPDELKSILGRENDYITAADGAALRAWVDGAVQVDPAVEKARSDLKMVCEQGMDALVAAWKKTPKAVRQAINTTGTCPDEYKLAAQEYDRLRQPAGDPALDDLNAELSGQAAE
jgi:AAA domain